VSTTNGAARADDALLAMLGPATSTQLLTSSARARVYRRIDQTGTARVVKLISNDNIDQVTGVYAALAGQPGANRRLDCIVSDEMAILVFTDHPRTLADQLAEAELSARELCTLLAPLADAIEVLNRAGFVHADIKPANILLSTDGPALLSDLDQALRTGAVAVAATAGFSPPELFLGRPVTAAADHFSFTMTVLTALGLDNLTPARHDTVPETFLDAVELNLSGDPLTRLVTPTALLRALGSGRTRPAHTGGENAQDIARVSQNLARAAREVFGLLDPYAVTIDRPPTATVASRLVEEDGDNQRSIWRHPAMITSLAFSIIAVAAVVLLLVY
jgi:serine/threonine protein kinase